MTHEQFLRDYERALATHSWEAIAPLIHDDACFVFSDGTYFGIANIEIAIRKTFAQIQDEAYAINNVRWVYVRDDSALCTYGFHWAGLIDGKPCEGNGRGTSHFVRDECGWKIRHEHLGPAAEP